MEYIVELCVISFVFFIGFLFGELRAFYKMQKIALAIICHSNAKHAEIKQGESIVIDKIEDNYYAYLGTEFLTQATNITQLVENIVKQDINKSISLSDAANKLTIPERLELVSALEKIVKQL